MKNNPNINDQLLADLVEAKRTAKDTLSKMSSEIDGLTQPTLSRILRGDSRISTKSAKALCDWVGVPLEHVQKEIEGKNITDAPTAKELAHRFERLAGLLNSEKISRSKFREMVAEELTLMGSDYHFKSKIVELI